MTDSANGLGDLPHAIGVKQVGTEELKENPHNPRMLFDREHLDTLKSSIAKVGILVPLTVYREEGSKIYKILDGQRRWMCALDLKLEKIPINEIAEPTVAQNIVTMFQIHKLRKDWELMPTALKLEVLMDELKERRDKQLAALTSLDVAVVVRCKKLLSYPKKYQDLMLFTNPADRIKADFFIELYPILNDRTVKKASWFHRDEFIERMLYKYKNKKSGMKSITDFRLIKQHITSATKTGQEVRILQRLKEFLDNDELLISHMEIESATLKKRATKLVKDATTFTTELANIETSDFYGEEEFWKALEKLMVLIGKKLKEADRRPE